MSTLVSSPPSYLFLYYYYSCLMSIFVTQIMVLSPVILSYTQLLSQTFQTSTHSATHVLFSCKNKWSYDLLWVWMLSKCTSISLILNSDGQKSIKTKFKAAVSLIVFRQNSFLSLIFYITLAPYFCAWHLKKLANEIPSC